jgi:hypothetical protein
LVIIASEGFVSRFAACDKKSIAVKNIMTIEKSGERTIPLVTSLNLNRCRFFQAV